MSVQFGQLVSNNDVTTAVLAHGTRCTVMAVRAFESGIAGDAYIQLFDAAAAADITLGTTKPSWVIMIDQGTGEVSAGDGLPTHGVVFANGIVIASTTTPAGNTTRESEV